MHVGRVRVGLLNGDSQDGLLALYQLRFNRVVWEAEEVEQERSKGGEK